MGQLRELAWLDQMYNIILMGPSGTGKTYITGGLIRDAVLKGYKAQFIPMDQLVEILRMKDVSTSAMSAYKHLTKCNLVGIDDIMLMPMKKEEAVAFFNLVNLLYENASLVITTNKAPTEWVEILQDEVLATALLDRILYHCDIIKLTGSSYRMENRSGFLNKNTYSSTSNQQKMRQKNESRLFNQMLIMRGIEEEYQQLCKSEKSVSTERVELLLGEVDAFLDEVLAILRDEGDNEKPE